MTVITKSEFARKINRSHQYVSALIKRGRVVLTKQDGREMVELEASLDKIAATADPANDPSKTMPRADGRTAQSVGMVLQGGGPAPDDDGSGQHSSSSTYQKSRAVKESYTARLKKVEFEEKMGKVISKAGVEKAAFGVARILREKLKALPNRLAPKVTVETDQKKNFILLTNEVESVIKEIQAAIAELIS